MLNIIGKSRIWMTISAILFGLSIISIAVFGLNLGIDFTGGSMLEIKFQNIERPHIDQIQSLLQEFNYSNINIQAAGENSYIIRTFTISEEEHQQILSKIKERFQNQDNKDSDIIEQRFESVGPVIGQEFKNKTIWAILLALIAIILYIAFTFRHVSKPVESWKYGLAAIIALIHDITIITGVFAILGHFINVQIDAYFITAILTILGYSVNDTIVTFDRIRENLHKKQNLTFTELVNFSINETLARSINTSLTVFMVLITIFLFGGESIRFFSLTLLIGVVIGTYSSIFVASPLMLFFYKRKYLSKK